MATADQILKIAQREVGVTEYPSGTNNVKYNTLYYGRSVQDTSTTKYPWCVVFQWWLFQTAGAANLFYGGNKTASCNTLMSYAKSHGLFVNSNYAIGDLVFLRFSKKRTTPEHIGIIKEVNASGQIVTIEGNTGTGNDANGGQVQQRTRESWQIVGAYRPQYTKEKVMDNTPKISKEAVEWATKNGIMNGNQSGDLMLSSPCTREQMMVFLYRYNQKFGK